MNRRLLLLLITAVIAAAGGWWLSRVKPTTGNESAASPAPAIFEKDAQREVTATPTAAIETPTPLSERADARDPRVKKLLERMAQSQQRGQLSRAAIEAFLAQRGRTGPSLLAAWQESRDDAYLREALQTAPNDPTVLLAAALSSVLAEERADLLARLKQADPNNPLPSWLAAAEHFAAQRSDAAFAELLSAEGRNSFQTHQEPVLDERAAMYLAAGFDPLRAAVEAIYGLTLGYLKPVQDARKGLADELPKMRARGEKELAQDLSTTALNLGRSMSDPRFFLIDQLVGISLEKSALENIGSAEGELLQGTSANARLAELDRRKNEIRDLPKAGDPTSGDVTYEQFVEYFRRMRADGEMSAMRWLAAQRQAR